MRSGVPREIAGSEGRSPQRVPPSPVNAGRVARSRSARPSGAPRDAGLPATEATRSPACRRSIAAARQLPPIPPIPGATGLPRPERAAAPRLPGRDASSRCAGAVVNRPAEAAVVAPPVQHPAEAQRPPGDARKARPETPGSRGTARRASRREGRRAPALGARAHRRARYFSSGASTGQTLARIVGCALASGWMRSAWNIDFRLRARRRRPSA